MGPLFKELSHEDRQAASRMRDRTRPFHRMGFFIFHIKETMNITIEHVLDSAKRRVLSSRKGLWYFVSGLLVGISLAILLPVTIIAKPQVYFSPEDSIDQKIVHGITEAKESIDIAIYSFTLPSIATSLTEARQRGVRIRVFFDKTQAASSSIDELLDANGIAVRRDTRSGLEHNKFMIIDGKKVFTGSYNFTKNATYRNRENLIEVLDQTVVARYAQEFEKLWSGQEAK